jgi:hypothetical protein
MKGLVVTLDKIEIQHKRTLRITRLCHYAECHYAECHYAKCHYAECHYAECHYAKCRYTKCHYAECRNCFNVMPSVIILNVVMLSVVAPLSTA